MFLKEVSYFHQCIYTYIYIYVYKKAIYSYPDFFIITPVFSVP